MGVSLDCPNLRHIPFFYQEPSSKVDTSYSIGLYSRYAKTEENDDYR